MNGRGARSLAARVIPSKFLAAEPSFSPHRKLVDVVADFGGVFPNTGYWAGRLFLFFTGKGPFSIKFHCW